MTSSKFMSSGTAAYLLSVTSRTIERWCKMGILTGFRTPGGHWRISSESVHTFSKRQAEQPAA